MATNKIICDTDVIIDYWDNKKVRHEATKHVIDNVIGLNNVLISAVTQIELLIGATNKLELIRINKGLIRFGVISIDDVTTKIAVQLIKDYNLSHGLALPDALIAASSIVTDEKLFTYNVKDYKFVKNLKLFDAKI